MFRAKMRPIIALVCLLCGLYFLTYLGDRISNDGNYLFDSVESFVNRGDFYITYHYDQLGPGRDFILPPAQQEPLQAILAAPLYIIAQNVPGIGLVHTVWLFNIFITTLTAALVYVVVRRMDYSPRWAFVAALIFGVATMAWPYTRTFFREPLAGLFLLIGFAAARYIAHRPAQTALLIASAAGILLTKSALLVAFGGVLLVALPARIAPRRIAFGVLAVIAALFAVNLIGQMFAIPRFQAAFWLSFADGIEWRYMIESLLGYTVSPGRSIFVFSPVLLLSFYGSALLWRRGDRRLVVGVWLALFAVILSYGLRTFIWWGGNGWGPRHLLPLIAPLFLLCVPALITLWRRGAMWRPALVGLIAVSVGVQILGSVVSIYTHYGYLAENGVLVWEAGIWSLRWSPIPNHIALFDLSRPDVAWHFAVQNVAPVIALGGGLVIVAGWLGWRRSLMVWGLPALLVVLLGFGLYQLRDDPRYLRGNAAIPPLIAHIETAANADDAVLLQATVMTRAFMNGFDGRSAVIALSYAAGENYDPAVDPAEWRDAPPADLLGRGTTAVIDWAGANHRRLWLVVDANPDDPDELRVTERHLLSRFYPLDRTTFSANAHALLFDTRAPLYGDLPADATSVVFGDALALSAYIRPTTPTYRPGDAVLVDLAWSALVDLPEDYLMSVQVAPAGLPPVAQYDGLPQRGFGRTSTWTAGTTQADHHGLILPDDLAAGAYNVQVIVYSFPSLERLTFAGDDDVFIIGSINVE